MEAGKQIESSSDVDKKLVCTKVQKDVNLSSLHPNRRKR